MPTRPRSDSKTGSWKHKSEGEDQRHDEIEIFADLRLQLDASAPLPPGVSKLAKNLIAKGSIT